MTPPLDDKKKSAAKAAPASVSKTEPRAQLAKLLNEGLVVYLETVSSKNEAISGLLARLCQGRNLGQPDTFLPKIMEREAGPTTTLDTGLAIPHARIDGIKEVSAILGLFQSALQDPAQPDLPIRCMFLFLAPNDPKFFSGNLQLLRKAAVTFQPAFIDKLLAAKSPLKAIELIRQKD